MMQHVQMKAVDDKFFTRSQNGAIWGRVYFEVGDEAFPDRGWTDLIAGFLTAWLEALTRIAIGSATQERVWFMDGPFCVDISVNGKSFLSVTFLHKEALKNVVEANVKELLGNAIDVGKQVIASCKQRGWADSDVGNLERAVRGGVDTLEGLTGSV
jgi:hypothetical protein